MSSETPVRLPVVDFSKDLKPGTAEWDSVKIQVRQAVEEYGCFEALFDKVLEVRNPLFGALEEVFDLPLQTKKNVSGKLFGGYQPHIMAPRYENFLIDQGNVAQNVEQHLTNLLWPQGNTSFSETLLSFSVLTSELEQTITRMILESFGLEKYAEEHKEFTNYTLRLVKYEGPQTSEPTRIVGSHSDKGNLTVLHQNDVNGLEIQSKDGEWINVKLSQNSFIVIIGECLSVYLNGRLPSPNHRLFMTGNKPRYCAGLISVPKGGYKVKTPEELVDQENPLLFKPFDYEEFLEYYYNNIVRGVFGNGVKVYCSV